MASVISESSIPALLPSVLNNVQAVGATWVISSAIFTTYSTTKYLRYTTTPDLKLQISKTSILPRATQLTVFRFSGSLILGLLVHPNLRVVKRIQETINLLSHFSIPAIFLFIANYFNSVALKRIGISLTYTSKCGIPLITLILTLLLDGRDSLPSIPVLLSLVPIGIGIGSASWNHPTFEPIGFLAAFVSCTAQSALNVTCKRAMNKINVSGALAQRAMVTIGLAIASVVSILQFSSRSKSGVTFDEERPPPWLTVAAVTAYHVEYVLSFMFVKLVAPITYSTCDAIRRLGIIIAGQIMFGGPPFTLLNIMGIGLALSGAVAYSILNN
jgi:multidrug transporter EmrE-like cation transporter